MRKYIVPTLIDIEVKSVLMNSASGDDTDSIPVYTDESQNVEDALARPREIWDDNLSDMQLE